MLLFVILDFRLMISDLFFVFCSLFFVCALRSALCAQHLFFCLFLAKLPGNIFEKV